MKTISLLTLAAVVAACTYKAPPVVEKEFVCYTDGKLTERHVGVQEAYRSYDGTISIQYVEGDRASYWPERGETCMVEEIR